MTNRWRSLLVMGILAALPASQLKADEASSDSMDSGKAHWESGKRHDPLGLTDDQKTQLKSIKEAGMKALRPLFEKQHDLREKLTDQLHKKASDSDIKSTLAAMKTNREAMKDRMEKMGAEKAAVLTPTQQARMMLWRRHGRHGDECECQSRHHHHHHHDDDQDDDSGN